MSEAGLRSPKGIADALSAVAEKKASAGVHEQFFLAALAGMYIGFGAIVATVVLSGGTLDQGLAACLAGAAFSVGLMLVIIPGSELFTGNILMTVGLLARRVRVVRMVRNWGVVWIGNFAGAFLLAWLMSQTGLLSADAAGPKAIAIADRKLALAFWPAFCRGVLCNMLVCLAVIMATAARSVGGKILAIVLPIMTFVAAGFEHSIANMYFLPAGLLASGRLGARFAEVFANLLPVTLGNIVGGLVLVVLHPKSQQMISRRIRGPSREASE